jgi:hypothetical protein
MIAFDGIVPNLVYSIWHNKLYLAYAFTVSETFTCFVSLYSIIPFVYRYMNICRNIAVTRRQFITLLFLVVLMSIIISGSNVYLTHVNTVNNFPDEFYWNESRECLPFLPIIDENFEPKNNVSC